MSRYEIHVRREANEVGISVTDTFSTDVREHKLVYKNGFICGIDYENDERFTELQDVFIKYVREGADISFRNNSRTANLLTKLIGDKILEYTYLDTYDPMTIKSDSDVDDIVTHKIITLRGGMIKDVGNKC